MIETGPDTIMMGGHQKKVIEFNARTAQVVNKVSSLQWTGGALLLLFFLVYTKYRAL